MSRVLSTNNIIKASNALKKTMSGEPITDEELRCGIKMLEDTINFLDLTGDRYYLITSELRRRL